jgi:hypothetical protein
MNVNHNQIANTQRPNVDLLKIDFQGIDQPDACLYLGSDNFVDWEKIFGSGVIFQSIGKHL